LKGVTPRRRSTLLVFAAGFGIACSSERPPPSGGGGTTQSTPGPVPVPADAYPDGPAGPYGVAQGEVLPNLELAGHVNLGAPFTRASEYPWKRFTFDDLHKSGKKLALVFFPAIWCGPCDWNARALDPFVAPFDTRETVVIEIVVDGAAPDVYPNRAAIGRWVDQTAVSYTTLVDPEERASRSKRLFGWDSAIVVDLASMRILFRGLPADALADTKRRVGF
jgi:thiol-disulfide isomerase/thioredoxin